MASFPTRLKELRTFSCFPLSQHIKMSLRLMVGAIPQELQGGGCCTWLLHIKQKYCIHQHAFLCSNIQYSTFHHLLRRWSPFLSRTGNVLHAFINQLSHTCPLQEENILLRTRKQKRFSVGWKIVFYCLIFCLNGNHSGFRSDV